MICAIYRAHLYTIRAYGLPKGQPRPRAFVRPVTGRAGVYDPGTAEGWKSEIARVCVGLEGVGLHQPLSVALTFYMPRPKSHYRPNGKLKPASPQIIHDKKPDADNLAKSVLDALTNIKIWLDDDQVCELIIRKYWEVPQGAPPGCVIKIAEMREIEG